MKRDRIIYYVVTGLLSLSLFAAGLMYFTDPRMAAGFKHLGFPGYFRIELAIGKLIGAIVLILPSAPLRIKEWCYVATAIVYTSAFIAHTSVDGIATAFGVFISFGLWAASVVFFCRINRSKNKLTNYVNQH